MKTHPVPACLALTLLALPLFPLPARADGGFFYNPIFVQESSTPPDMHSQRGMLLVSADRFELTIQSRYQGNPEDFGWVIPLPALPRVEQGDAQLMDQLDAVSSPSFRRITTTYGCPGRGSGMDAGMAGGSGGNGVEEQDKVTVWSRGHLGILEYAVLEATSVAVLQQWLDKYDFRLPQRFTPIVDHYVNQKAFFFCARIRPGVKRTTRLQPVRLVFDPSVAPVFPMRITAVSTQGEVDVLTSVPPLPGEDVLLLVLSPDKTYLPATYPVGTIADASDPEDYERRIGEAMAQQKNSTFVVQHAMRLQDHITSYDYPYGYYGGSYSNYWDNESFVRYRLQQAGLAGDPLPELLRWFDDGWVLTRLRARLTAAAMTQDVLLAHQPITVNSQFTHTTTLVPSDGPPAPARDDGGPGAQAEGQAEGQAEAACQAAPGVAGPPWGLVLVGLLTLSRRRRRRGA